MIFVLAAAVLFGFVHPGSKLILNQGIDFQSFCILYVAIRLVAQLPFVISSKSYRVSKTESRLCLFMIGISGAGLQLAEFMGIANGLAVPLVTFLVYSHPIWSLLFSRTINREALNLSSFLKLFFGLIGVLLIAGSSLNFEQIRPLQLLPPILAGVLIALWVSLSNKAKQAGSSTWTISFYYDLFALLALLAVRWASFTEAMPLSELSTWLMAPKHLLAITTYSVFVGLLPNFLFYRGNQTTTARTAGFILLLEPLVATAVSHRLWTDELPRLFFVGGFFILLAGLPFDFLRISQNFYQRISPVKYLAFFILTFFPIHFLYAKDAPAVHGMLVFGNQAIYFSHLPMFHSPHNYQVVFQVELGSENQKLLLEDQASHPGTIYSFVPEPMVLPDVIREKRAFNGDLYRGHFERGGVAIKTSLRIEIKKIIYFHKFDPQETRPTQLTYLLFGNNNGFWLAHLISQKPDFDQILSVDWPSINWNGAPTLVAFPHLLNSKPLVDGQTYTCVSGAPEIEFRNVKQNYLELDDLSM